MTSALNNPEKIDIPWNHQTKPKKKRINKHYDNYTKILI